MVRIGIFVATPLGDGYESVSFGDGSGIVRHGSKYRFVGVSARVRPSLSRLGVQIPRPIQTARPAPLEFSRRPSPSNSRRETSCVPKYLSSRPDAFLLFCSLRFYERGDVPGTQMLQRLGCVLRDY